MTDHVKKAIDQYLEKFEAALCDVPALARKEALRDAEEYLRNESSELYVTSAEEAFEHFVGSYGEPTVVANEYERCSKEGLKSPSRSGWSLISTIACAVFILSASIGYAIFHEPPKLSPFTQVDIEGTKIWVEYQGTKYQWLAIDDISVANLITSAKKQFNDRWKKRITQDLVEVLWAMEHSPGGTVKLLLKDPKTNKQKTIADAVMTYENRQVVYMRELKKQESLQRAIQLDPVKHVQQGLQDRWAYYPLKAKEIDEALASLRSKLTQDPGGLDWDLEFQKVIACGIDGHASVSGWSLPGRRLPFLVESVGGRYVAFLPDRSGFVDPQHPFLDAIDGKSIDEWCQVAAVIIPKGSPQFIKRHALRHLRAIDYWRAEQGREVSDLLNVQLSSPDGSHTIEKQLETNSNQPIYGKWPRSQSELLEGNIGYLRLESMNHEAEAEIANFMPKFRDTRGLIVDVRGNGGGSRSALRLMFSYLMAPDDRPRVVNCAKYRLHPDFDDDHLEVRYMYPANSSQWSGAEQTAINEFQQKFQPEWNPPDADFSGWHYLVLNQLPGMDSYHYAKPVVVLMDAKCFSAADIFLTGLKGWRNVTLLGTPSGGGSARSVGFRLRPIGFRASLASMVSFQPDGKLFDGHGVTPDILVEPTPEFFVGGEDAQLKAAMQKVSGN